MSKSITVTKDMLVWHDDRCGMYNTPQGYVLIEYATGKIRSMSVRQAKSFLKRTGAVKE